MFWNVIFCFFAAAGVLFLLWLTMGAFLPGNGKFTLAVRCLPGEELALVRRYRWLRELGLVRGCLVFLDSSLPQGIQAEIVQHYPGVIFSTTEQWLQERK